MMSDEAQAKEDSDAKGTLEQPAIGPTLFTSLASALLNEQSQPSPHHTCSHNTTAMWQTRKLYGRWLAVRRLCQNITDLVVAVHAGVDAQSLRLLELGLLTDEPLDDVRWDKLARLLADADDNADFVWIVIQCALGNTATLTYSVVNRVTTDLRRISNEVILDTP